MKSVAHGVIVIGLLSTGAAASPQSYPWSGDVSIPDEWPMDGNNETKGVILGTGAADVVFSGDRGTMFGQVVTTGDFNGDGYPDIAVSARRAKDSWGLRSAGVIYLFLHKGTWSNCSNSTNYCYENAITFKGLYGNFDEYPPGPEYEDLDDKYGDLAGTGMDFVDLDNDGYDDLVIGAELAVDAHLLGCVDCVEDALDLDPTAFGCCGNSNVGRVFIVYGEPTATQKVGNKYVLTDVLDDTTAYFQNYNYQGDETPTNVMRLDNDTNVIDGFDICSFRSDEHGTKLGRQIVKIFDLDGDGVDELAIADASRADGADGGAGAVFLLYGQDNVRYTGVYHLTQHLYSARNGDINDPLYKWGAAFYGSIGEFSYLGYAGSGGDFDGDNYNELVLGEVNAPALNSTDEVGAAYVIWGGPNRLSGIYDLADLHDQNPPTPIPWGVAYIGDKEDSKTGWRVAGIGNFNGEGGDEIAISAPRWSAGCSEAPDPNSKEGIVWILTGLSSFQSRPIGPIELSFSTTYLGWVTADDCDPQGPTGQEGMAIGWDVRGAGDIDGDGRADFFMTAPAWSTGLGNPHCATGGTCNPTVDGLPGKCYVIYGASGFPGSHPWGRTVSDVGSSFPGATFELSSGIKTDSLGVSVIPIGLTDLNGSMQGFVVTAPGPDTSGNVKNRGRAFLFSHSTTPPPSAPGDANNDSPTDRLIEYLRKGNLPDLNNDGVINSDDIEIILGWEHTDRG